MTKVLVAQNADDVRDRIFSVREEKVILDADLANIYGVATRVLNQAVKRNTDKFPVDFMFRLTAQEFTDLKSQTVTSSSGGKRSQVMTGSGPDLTKSSVFQFTYRKFSSLF